MSQANSNSATFVSRAPAGFAGRAPSQAWERAPLGGGPHEFVWVWFKPANAPQSLIVRVPDDVFQAAPQLARTLTLRRILQATGVEPTSVSMWTVYGVPYDGMNGMNPYLDAPVPPPAAGVDPSIVVCVSVPHADAGPFPAAPAGAVDGYAGEAFERIETDWNATLQIETDLKRIRKMLVDMSGKLQSLNRDLTPLERLHADNQDKKDWLDARRWLRDCGVRLSSCLKDHDLGYTSAAGQRKWFEDIYEQFVVPRQPFDGLLQAQRNFESYRKMVVTLQTKMNAAYSHAALNGERRAQQILSRIAAKIRDAQTKKNFLGVIAD